MSQSSQSILDHIAEMLQFISNTQSFWFTLDSSYIHGYHPANQFRLEPEDYKVVSPLVAQPSCCLIVPAGFCIASCCPLIAPPSRRLVARQLVVTSPLAILSLRRPLVILSRQLVVALPLALVFLRHHLVSSLHQLVVTSPLLVLLLRPAPPSRLLVELAGYCRPLVVSSSRHLVVSSCLLLLSCHVSWLSRHHLSSPSHCTALSSSHRAGYLLCCLSLHRPLVLSL